MKQAAFTKNAPDKPRNGDYFSIIEHNSGAIIAVLADGSGSSPCDWKAAEIAVTVFETAILKVEEIDKAEVAKCVAAAAKEVSDMYGLCAGARSSMAVAAVGNDGAYWLVNLGRSSIFHYNGSDLLEQISGQKTCFLGEKLPQMVVLEGRLNRNEGIVLLSRGVVEHSGRAFLPDFRYLFSKANPDKNLPLLMEKYVPGQVEDMTALFVVFE